MTRSADDETLRVLAGCLKHPVHRSCLRRTPGRDSTLERRSPEVKTEAAVSIESASRSPLGERSARAFRLAIPWHEPATCGAAAMPRNHHAMPNRMSASTRSQDRHLAFCASEDRGSWLRLAAACALSALEPRVTWLSTTSSLPRKRRVVSDRICLLASPASTTLLHGSTLAESTSPSARYEVSSLLRAARRV
jgi:hypothetical protein